MSKHIASISASIQLSQHNHVIKPTSVVLKNIHLFFSKEHPSHREWIPKKWRLCAALRKGEELRTLKQLTMDRFLNILSAKVFCSIKFSSPATKNKYIYMQRFIVCRFIKGVSFTEISLQSFRDSHIIIWLSQN